MSSGTNRNRLADESSPYLRQHAANPVDWYPWGPEALERAKREDKPILLSVGYSACHWCHVMAHESFEDDQTAALMNDHFVNIKIDREERPDLDQLYQGVVQLIGRGGGWPLTVFLTPDLRPFYGGTYFPPTPRHGLPAFGGLLSGVALAWEKERADIETQAEQFKRGLTDLAAYGLEKSTTSTWTGPDISEAALSLAHVTDRKHGGFGQRGPKFPNPMNLALMFRGYRRTGTKDLLDAALLTLEKMALGGIFDQLGGGFHRYAVDERWLVPHFEKMIYDNALLIHLYSEAMQLAPRPLWKRVVEESIGYVQRELTSPEGAFYTAHDADSEGEEGKFFVWKRDDIARILGAEESKLFFARFDVQPSGNFEHGNTILEVVRDEASIANEFSLTEEVVHQRLDASRAKLLQERATRVRPGLDDKLLAGWNGLMIRGLAFASRVFHRPEWLAMATRAADFVLTTLVRPDGSMARSAQGGTVARHAGVLEDSGDLAAGLTALYQAGFDAKYLEAAERIADRAVTDFWDASKNAYFAAARSQTDLLVPTYALHDNAFPSGASTLSEALVTLGALTGRQRHLDQAAKYLDQLRKQMIENPMGYGHALLAADTLIDGAAEVTIVGHREATRRLVDAIDARYTPTLSVQCYDPATPAPSVISELLAGRSARGSAAAYLCQLHTCQAPVTEVAELEAILAPLRRA